MKRSTQDSTVEALLYTMVEMTFIDEKLSAASAQYFANYIRELGGPAPMPSLLYEVIRSYEGFSIDA